MEWNLFARYQKGAGPHALSSSDAYGPETQQGFQVAVSLRRDR